MPAFVTNKQSVSVNIHGNNVKNKKQQKLLGKKFDSSLSFEGYITSLSKEASQKLHAAARLDNNTGLLNRMALMQAFITSPFSH